MKSFKKIIFVLAAIFAISPIFAAKKEESKKIKIVTTIFPIFDWTREILGEKEKDADLTFLLANGVDLHSFQPKARDMKRISSADIFVFVGGESDEWVEDALESVKNPNQITLSLIESLGEKAKIEEEVEGMEHHHDDDDDEDEGMEHHDDDDDEIDEHVWLSVRNAKILCTAICDAICEKDSENAPFYKKNLENYCKKLDELDGKFQKVVDSSNQKTLIFGDRFPFRYFTDDYGLKYYAAFAGCSSESEASFKTIIFLSNKLDEINAKVVCKIDGSDGKIAKSVIKNSKTKSAKVIEFDSMQSTNARAVKKGANYLSIMEKNLLTLQNALK